LRCLKRVVEVEEKNLMLGKTPILSLYMEEVLKTATKIEHGERKN